MEFDRELLFAVFATQLKGVLPSRLAEATRAADGDASLPLGSRLVGLGVLNEFDRELIERFVAETVSVHEGDTAKALETFGGRERARGMFAGALPESELERMATVHVSQILSLGKTGELTNTMEEAPGRYFQLSEYARGGMGRVLLVHDGQIGRNVALKELLLAHDSSDSDGAFSPVHKTASLTARFLHEARITGQLEHPSIVPVYEVGRRRDGRLYYTMKLVRGKTLSRAIREAGSLKQRLALLPHFVDLCHAIAYAHSRGVIHRDIKPANVMVGEFGETVVLDWGIAKSTAKEATRAMELGRSLQSMGADDTAEAAKTAYGQALGTPAYMSPEQAEGLLDVVDERSDVYSLGAVLYELLSGKAPFSKGTSAEVVEQVKTSPPKPLGNFRPTPPPELAAICEKAMHRARDKRYGAAKTMTDEIRRFENGALVETYRYSPGELLRRFWRRHRSALTAAAIAVLVVTSFGIYSIQRIVTERNIAVRARAAEHQAFERAEAARHIAETQSYLASMRAVPSFIKEGRYDMALASLWQTSEACRNWEWGYFLRQCRRDVFALPGQRGLALSPDGTRIATISGSDTAAIWDAATGHRVADLTGHTGQIASVAFSPDGARAVTASYDRTARIWDVETGDCMHVLQGHKDYVLDATFSPAGTFVVARAFDNSSKMWDAQSAKEPFPLFNGSFDARCVAFSPDGEVLAMGALDATAQIRDTRSGERLATFPGDEEPLLGVAFSPDGSRIVTECGWRQTIALWDAHHAARIRILTTRISREEFENVAITTGFNSGIAELQDLTTGETILKITGEGTPVRPMFSPDGALVAAGHRDGSLGLWDGHSGEPHVRLDHAHDAIRCASFSPNGERIAVGCSSGAIVVYDTATGAQDEVLKGHSSAVERVEYDPSGAQLYSSAGSVRKWALGRHRQDTCPLRVPSHRAWGHHVTLTPDGHFAVGDMDGKFTAGHVERSERFVVCQNFPLSHMDAALSCGRGKMTAVCSSNVWVWNTTTGKAVHRLEGHDSVIECLAVAPHHPLAATGDAQGNVRIWDLDDDRERVAIAAHSDKVCAITFGPFGRLLATAAQDGVIKVWRSADGSLVHEIPRLPGRIRALGFASKGPWLAAAFGKTVHIWDKADASWHTTCAGHLGDVRDLTFSPDGSRLATASGDRSVRVWDVETGAELACLRGHGTTVVAVTFGSDGTSLMSVGDDLELRIWRTVPWDAADLPKAGDAAWEARFDAYLLARAATAEPKMDSKLLHFLVVESPEDVIQQLETFTTAIESGAALAEAHGNGGVALRQDLEPACVEGLFLAPGDILYAVNGAPVASGIEWVGALNATAKAVADGAVYEVLIEALRNGKPLEIVIRLKEVELVEKEQGISIMLVKLVGREAIDILKRGIDLFEPARRPNGEMCGIRIAGVDGLFQNRIYAQLGLAEDNVGTHLAGRPITSVQGFIDMLDEIFAGIEDGTVNEMALTVMRGKFQRMLLTLRNSDPGFLQ